MPDWHSTDCAFQSHTHLLAWWPGARILRMNRTLCLPPQVRRPQHCPWPTGAFVEVKDTMGVYPVGHLRNEEQGHA